MMRRILYSVLAVLLLAATPASAVPAIQQATLANGLKVLLVEAHNVPMVSMQLAMPAGSRFDPAGKAGSAAMLALMLTDHTARHDNEALAEWLDARAIRLGADADKDTLGIGVTTLTEQLTPALDILAECLLDPGWDRKRFKLLQQDAVAAAQKSLEEPGVRASQAAAELLFAGHPYGHRSDGTPESLKVIGMSDLKGIYRAQLKPQGAVLAVSGDITMAQLLPLLEARLAGWQGTPVIGMFDLQPAAEVVGKSVQIAMPTTQTLLELVRQGPSRKADDFFPAFVMNHMLGGGGFGSQLMSEVREKRGLVYGVYSYFVPLAVPGAFAIMLQTRADQADAAAGVVRQVMRDMAAGKVDAKRLRAVKDNLIGSFAQRMDSNRERVGLMAMIGMYDLPLDYLQVWTDRVESVTLRQVRDEAAKWLDPAAWNEIRVGPVQQKGKHS